MFDIEEPNYERFHLERNPFTELSSEAIEDVESIHVSQSIDSKIAEALGNVLENGSSVGICIVGDLGTGKTQRLLGITRVIEENGGFALYLKLDSSNVIKTTYDIFRYFPDFFEGEISFLDRILKFFGLRRNIESKQLSLTNYDSTSLADELKHYLEPFGLSALVLDEVENIMEAPKEELILFFEFLRQFISKMPYSCVFVIALTREGYERLKKMFPAFVTRLHYILESEKLSEEKAKELVQKRLEIVRTKEMLNPLYPFDEDAISMVNDIAKGNPRILLRILQIITTAAALEKLIDVVDEKFVLSVVRAPTSVEEYLSRVPKDLKQIVDTLIKDFGGGPASYIKLAKEAKMPPTEMYVRLEELVSMGLLLHKGGKYEVVEKVKNILEQQKKAIEKADL